MRDEGPMPVVGPTCEDARVFQAATACETAFGRWYLDAADRPSLPRVPSFSVDGTDGGKR